MGITKNGQKFHTLARLKTLHVSQRFSLHVFLNKKIWGSGRRKQPEPQK
jgi:hypothetical protein